MTIRRPYTLVDHSRNIHATAHVSDFAAAHLPHLRSQTRLVNTGERSGRMSTLVCGGNILALCCIPFRCPRLYIS